VPASLGVAPNIGARLAPITSTGAVLQAEAVWHRRTVNPALSQFLNWSKQMFDPQASDELSRNRDQSP
jgi:hypothetical protein